MSNANGSYPPVWRQSSLPFSQTRASQSTASKRRTIRRPFHAAGTWNVRRYHRRWSGPTCLPTPDNPDSGANGTKIVLSNLPASGCPSSFGRIAYCQRPLRFCQSARVSCGRGYSGCTLSGTTSFAKRLTSVPETGFHADCARGTATKAASSRAVDASVRTMARRVTRTSRRLGRRYSATTTCLAPRPCGESWRAPVRRPCPPT